MRGSKLLGRIASKRTLEGEDADWLHYIGLVCVSAASVHESSPSPDKESALIREFELASKVLGRIATSGVISSDDIDYLRHLSPVLQAVVTASAYVSPGSR